MVADERIRGRLQPVLAPLAAGAERVGLRPGHLTALGLALAVAAAGCAAVGSWWAATGLWLLSRVPDGVDGALARRTGTASDLGGLLDLTADFLAYGAFVLGVAVGAPDARVACAALLLTYYVNGSVLLATSAAAERQGRRFSSGDRSVQFVGGLTEGFETIVAHALFGVLAAVAPAVVPMAVWVFAAMVVVTIGQRLRFATHLLRDS